MPPRYRWALLTLALLFVFVGGYAVTLKTQNDSPDPGSKIITPIAPSRAQRGMH